jgi:hypothetical protein
VHFRGKNQFFDKSDRSTLLLIIFARRLDLISGHAMFFFSRERSSTGSNDCFVVLVVLVVLVFYPLVI